MRRGSKIEIASKIRACMERDASNPPTYSKGEERGELGRCYSVAHGFHTRTKRTGRQLVSYVLIEARFDVLCLEPIFQR